MIAVTILLVLLAVVWTLDGLRLRARLAGLPVAAGEADAADFVLLAAPGVELDPRARRVAAGFASQHDHELVDLLPARAPAWRLLWFASLPVPKRDALFDPVHGAGWGVLVSRALLARTGRVWQKPRTAAEASLLFTRLARYTTKHAAAVVPGLAAPAAGAASDDPAGRLALVGARLHDLTGVVVLLQAAVYGFALAGPLLALVPGIACLAALHLQPLVVFAGAPARPRHLVPFALLRSLAELAEVARQAAAWRPEREPGEIAARRAAYAAGPDASFLEPRRDDCPLCHATDLVVHLESGDLVTFKPGTFTLERCRACGHIFQNPRLSLAGLEYYYRDVYDGLGEDMAEQLFGVRTMPYGARAKSIEGLAQAAPRTWLDVGGGHGHFARVVRDTWPGLRVDGLDMSESIDDAARRGWVDRALRGVFPELARRLRATGERYDVVSMSHYLEHTLDPAAELAAANRVLASGGLLMIEVPDPESRLGALLGRFWFPWLQPQHLHFVSATNLDRLLRDAGFEAVRWHRGEAHLGGELMAAVYLALSSIAPPPRAPWHPAPGAADLVWRAMVLTAGLPLMGVARLFDAALSPVFRRAGWSDTYRVVARKVADVEAAEPVGRRAA
jgi:SAM-dependent methyltransferase